MYACITCYERGLVLQKGNKFLITKSTNYTFWSFKEFVMRQRTFKKNKKKCNYVSPAFFKYGMQWLNIRDNITISVKGKHNRNLFSNCKIQFCDI